MEIGGVVWYVIRQVIGGKGVIFSGNVVTDKGFISFAARSVEDGIDSETAKLMKPGSELNAGTLETQEACAGRYLY